MAGLIPLSLSQSPSSVCDAESPNPPRLKRRSAIRSPTRRPQPTPCSLLDIPYTSCEWKRALGEIKRDYQIGKYRACSARCDEISDNIRNHDNIEPTYLIYLRFYAASSLEMRVRNLNHTSPHRIDLLLQAQKHYQAALDLAKAKDDALSQPPPCRTPSPDLFSPQSPGGSVTSDSTSSTVQSPPTPSFRMVQCMVKPLQPIPKRKKQVAFRDMPIIEPAVRPDSPTLGGADEVVDGTSSTHLVSEPLLLPDHKEAVHFLVPRSPTPQLEQYDEEPEDSSRYARSILRFCTVLSGLKSQIVCHLAFIEAEIAVSQKPLPPLPPSADRSHYIEMQARIQRLRAVGWKRPRFDPLRYETLREKALADLMD